MPRANQQITNILAIHLEGMDNAKEIILFLPILKVRRTYNPHALCKNALRTIRSNKIHWFGAACRKLVEIWIVK